MEGRKNCKCYISKKIQETNVVFSNWRFFPCFFFLCVFSSLFIIFHSRFWPSLEQQSGKGHVSNMASNINKIINHNYDIIVFLKILQRFIFMDNYFFSYFRGFVEETFNSQESIYEKILLVAIHLQEWLFISQYNFEYLTEINVLVSIFFKISRECNLTNESQIHNIRENIFRETF